MKCKEVGCSQLVMPVPDKTKSSGVVKIQGGGQWVCRPTKTDPEKLCYFHKKIGRKYFSTLRPIV